MLKTIKTKRNAMLKYAICAIACFLHVFNGVIPGSVNPSQLKLDLPNLPEYKKGRISLRVFAKGNTYDFIGYISY